MFDLVLFYGRGVLEGGKMDTFDFNEEILHDGKVLSVGWLSQVFIFQWRKHVCRTGFQRFLCNL